MSADYHLQGGSDTLLPTMDSTQGSRQTDFKYPGDEIDTSAPIKSTGYETINIDNPALLVSLYDDNIASGQDTLHEWQVNVNEELAHANATSLKPHKFCLCACNGSGKDLFVIAPFCIWFTLTKKQSRVIVTSSSGSQLTAQTENYIKLLAEKVNKFHGCEIFRIRQRYIKCRLTGSEIRLFATDEAGKAEGYHPMFPGAEMAIIVNEGKTVTDEIHKALRRCSGFNYWLEVSTPGEPNGFFHTAFTKWNDTKRVDWTMCPHISPDEEAFDRMEFGEHSAQYRSQYLALFTNLSGESIITVEVLNELFETIIPQSKSKTKRIGIDIAAGGDENCVMAVEGNKVTYENFCREKDTTRTADWIEHILLNDLKLEKSHDFIYADDGGIGHAVIDMLVRKGWTIKRVLNQWPAISKRQYGNRGAENWYRVKRLIEEKLIDITQISDDARKQLVTRRYKQALSGARIYLESKKEAKANGRPSPDRADALILAFTGLTIDDFLKDQSKDSTEIKKEDLVINGNQALVEHYEKNVTYKPYEEQQKKRSTGTRIYNSLKKAIRGS